MLVVLQLYTPEYQLGPSVLLYYILVYQPMDLILIVVQAGSGTFKTTGYLGAAAVIEGTTGYTVGFGIGNSNVSNADLHHGTIVLNLLNPSTNTWIAGGTAARSDSVEAGFTSGAVSLDGTLDRIRFTTVGGTDTFDAGVTNIMWE